MRQLIITSAVMSCSFLLLTGCNKEIADFDVTGTGEVRISLAQEAQTKVPETGTFEFVPEINDFKVEIFDKDSKRRFRDIYGNAAGKKISLNAGSHRIFAQYGDSAGVGFRSIYYSADQSFEVRSKELVTVNAVAKMTKVKVAISFGEMFPIDYDDWYAVLKTSDGKSLKFQKDETRAGYMPAGDISLEVFVLKGSQWKYFKADPLACAPSDFVHFNLDLPRREGQLMVNVQLDNSVETVEKHWEIPESAAPMEVPSIHMVSSFEGTAYRFSEAEGSGAQLRADLCAMAGVGKLVLKFNCPSVPELADVDLAMDDPSVEAAAGRIGIRYLKDMKGKRLSYIDFTGFLEYLMNNVKYNPEDTHIADFQFILTDLSGTEISSETYTFDIIPAEWTFNLTEGDVWARKISPFRIEVASGNPERFLFQYKKSTDEVFTSVKPDVIDGKILTFNSINYLDPDTEYIFRSIYNDNPASVSPDIQIRTEKVLQVGNAGFEEWTNLDFDFKITLAGNGKQKWFQPWNDVQQAWWAVNSKKSMIPECTRWNLTFKVFPTVSYTSVGSGNGNTLQVTSTGYGAWASPGAGVAGVIPGEIWIGTDDGSGNHKTDGHAFTSRPSHVSYWRKNMPVNGESTRFYLELKDAEGLTIGSAESKDATVDAAGKTITLEIKYTDLTKKASSIYISILSSTSGNPTYDKAAIDMAGVSYEANLGSRIYIDDIQLLYN